MRSKLETLEKKENELLTKLIVVRDKINEAISDWPIIYISSTDSDYARPSGKYHINCSPEKLIGVKFIHCASEHDEVELENEKQINFDEFFTENEIDSLREVGK